LDRFKIDGHKIQYHLDRLIAWQNSETVYPIYVEISPSGACNHRCVFCALDYLEYAPRLLDTGILKRRISEMAAKKVRSIMFGGEGEPLLHKDLAEIITQTREEGIDSALTTNAVALTERFLDVALPCLTWIKVSVNAGSPETYAKLHTTRPEDFDRVFENLTKAVEIRKKKKTSCTLGAQIVLLPENAAEVKALADRCKKTGLDYLVVKPYSQHPKSITKKYSEIRYDAYYGLTKELEPLNDENFNVVFRQHTMEKLNLQTPYARCAATPHFWAYVMATGDVYACSAFLGDTRFRLGNILAQSFEEVWSAPERTQCARILSDLDITECRKNCRMDEVNRYLWDLKHPPSHVNFI